MKGSPNLTCLGNECAGRNVLIRPEGAEVRRLTALVGSVFKVPVAYAAMLGHRDQVMSRIGTGQEYWPFLKTFPLDQVLESPRLVRDAREGLPEGVVSGGLNFFASAPIGTLCGQDLGVLVIADHAPRPEFSEADLQTLAELAAILAGKLELRMIASQSVESKLLRREAETRFRWAADCVPTLIACTEPDGSCSFINQSWLDFTGRSREEELQDGWQSALHPDHRDAFLDFYWESIQARAPFALTIPLLCHDGSYHSLRATATPRLLEDATFLGFTLCLSDPPAALDPPPPA